MNTMKRLQILEPGRAVWRNAPIPQPVEGTPGIAHRVDGWTNRLQSAWTDMTEDHEPTDGLVIDHLGCWPLPRDRRLAIDFLEEQLAGTPSPT